MLVYLSAFLVNFAWFILAGLLLYLAGHLLTLPFKSLHPAQGFFTRIFTRLLAGLCASVFLVSIATTRGVTVNTGLALVALMLLFELRLQKKKAGLPPDPGATAVPASGPLRYAPCILLAALFVFTWFARLVLQPGAGAEFLLADKDKIYYATLADMLSLGQENRAGVYNLLDPYYHGAEPYHYFELWLTNLFMKLTGQPATATLYLFTYPLLAFSALAGIMALVERFRQARPLHFLLAAALLFTSGLYFNQREPDAWYTMNFAESPMEFMGEKFGPYYLFLLLAAIFLLKSQPGAAAVSLLFLPVISISTAPTVLCALFIQLGWRLIKRTPDRRSIWRLLAYLALLALFLFSFYRIFGINHNSYLSRGLRYYTDLESPTLTSLKIYLVELYWRVCTVPFRFLLLHALLPLLVLLVYRRAPAGYRALPVFTLIIYMVSLLLYGTFYRLFEGVQFYTNNLVFVNVLAIVTLVILFALPAPGWMHRLCAVSVILALGAKMVLALGMHNTNRDRSQVYDPAYLAEIRRMTNGKGERQLVGAFYADAPPDRDLRHDDRSGINIPYLPYMPGCYPAIDLSAQEIRRFYPLPAIGGAQREAALRSPFMRQVMHEISQGSFKNYQVSQLAFVREHHLRYLVISPNAQVSGELEDLIDAEVRDARSGERFARLR
jgi:hypothetical protein